MKGYNQRMPSRFVILYHVMPDGADRPSHWDLFLEEAESLRAWAITSEPALGTTCDCLSLPPHRLHYLEYEGPVEGDRGEVTQWDKGRYEVLTESPYQWTLRLHGKKLDAMLSLSRSNEGEPAEQKPWTAKFCTP